MRQATEEQERPQKRKVADSSNEEYADKTLKKYERKIKQVVHGMSKGIDRISVQDRQDMVIDVCHDFWKLLNSGEFRGEYGDASIKACIATIARNKKNSLFRKLITEKKRRAYEPFNRARQCKPNGEAPAELDPWIEEFSTYFGKIGTAKDTAKEYEKQEGGKFIERETKYPEIIDSYRKGYSIKVIARTYGLTDEQVKKRIQREKKRLAKIAKQQGWYYE